MVGVSAVEGRSGAGMGLCAAEDEATRRLSIRLCRLNLIQRKSPRKPFSTAVRC
jgi:hypothetical protein